MTAPVALRRGPSIWLRGANRAARYPRVRGRLDADVAIVGAGITGALIAAVFAEAGVRVVVVDAARAAGGSTAASTALLLQEPDYDLAALGRLHTPARARRLWRLSHDTTRAFLSAVRRFHVDCDLRRRDTIYYTLDRHAALRRDWRRRRRAGFNAAWLGPAPTQRATGFEHAAAILTTGNARLDPVKACRGFLAAARRMGARIFEHSEVRRVRRVKDGVRLYCPTGTIDARQVIIATGYATRYFRPLAGRFRMRRTYVVVTAPIPPRLRRRMGLRDVLLWDTERPYHYARWTDDGRLLLGGEDRPVKPGPSRARQFAEAIAELREYFHARLPPLRDVAVAGAWEGLFAMTPDGLPYVGPHRRYPGHAFALGYGGNGMSFAALAARILLEQWHGATPADHRLVAFNRFR